MLAFSACDDSAPTPPADDDPESIRVEAPASVDEGEDFQVTVRVFGESTAEPLTSFSGTVQLGTSAGTITPTSLQVSAGVGTTTALVSGTSGEVTLTAALGTLTASAVLDVVPSFRTLEGDPDEPVAGAIPDSVYTFDPADYSDDHPDLTGLQTSFRVMLISFELGTTVSEANRILAPYTPQIVGGVRGIPGVVPGILVLRLGTSSHAAMDEVIQALEADAAVANVVQDVLLEGLEPANEASGGVEPVVSGGGNAADGWTWSSQPSGGNWGLELMRVPQMWNTHPMLVETVFDDPVNELPRTGIWDAGFVSHPDLGNLISISSETFDFDGIDHGVHVAGTIGATFDNERGVDGVNPLAKMHGLIASGSWLDIIPLLAGAPELAVLNVSLGYNWYKAENPKNPNTDDEIKETVRNHASIFQIFLKIRREAGTATPLIFSAAGNDSGTILGNVEARWGSPFNYAALELGETGIVVVEAVGQSDAAPGGAVRAPFSNVDGHVSAPGVGILSTSASTEYAVSDGTSMATPHVTGLAGYLVTLEPSLTPAQLRELLTANAVAVGGGAMPRVDAFASAMDIDRLTGSPHVLRMIVDIDDGTEDGNRRTDPDANDAEFDGTDADANGAPGDGQVSMSDFRRWRDAYLAVAQPNGLDLDGRPKHPKKDANGNKKTPADGDDEEIYSFADLNGDGKVALGTTAFFPGRLNRNVTDLQVLKELFSDPHYQVDHLDELVQSADVAVRPAKLLEADGVVEIRSDIRPKGADEPEAGPRFNRVHTGQANTGDGLWQVYTVPVADEGYTVRAVALDAAGDTLYDLEKEFEAKPGQDSFWDPEEEPFEYTEAFDTTAGPEWSIPQIAVAPNGQRFLGQFNVGEVRLALEDLPPHVEVIVEFDLHIIDDWNGHENLAEPDIMEFRADGVLLLRASFSNQPHLPQTYPDGYPGPEHPAGTDALGIELLGYPRDEPDEWGDASYRVRFEVPHMENTLQLRIFGRPDSSNEKWGIDNVRVTTTAGGS